MFLHEPDDLRLREAQTVEIGRKTVVDLAKSAVLGHLEDRNLLFLGRLTRDIKIPVAEVAVEVTVEGVLGLGDGFGTVRLVEGERFRARDEFEVAFSLFNLSTIAPCLTCTCDKRRHIQNGRLGIFSRKSIKARLLLD